MFIKPFKIKSNVQLKGSDVKKLKTRIAKQFNLSDADTSLIFPNKNASYGTVKIITYGEQQVTVYTADKRPMIFELDDKLYPTLYALWLSPKIVPYICTHPQVLPKLANGADLMLPGVVKEGSDLKSFGRFQKGDIVAVNLTSNTSAVGIGTLARDSEDLYMSGGQGICVKMLHVFGDKLWAIEPSVTQQIPLNGPVVKAPTLNNENDFPALGAEPSTSSSATKDVTPAKTDEIQDKLENITITNENLTDEISPDEVLKRMFLSALKLSKKELLNSLPILVGTFYPLYVQKQSQPNPDKPITVKDTTFKKLSTFMKRMSDDGFIVVREETKGVDKIISINYDHPELVSHVAVKDKNVQNENKAEATPHLLLTKMTELYVVNDATKKLFNSLGVANGKALDSAQIKNYVKDYVARNKLLNAVTKEVTLDDILVEICVGQRENNDVILMSLENITAIVLSLMDNTFEMRSQSGPQMKGGKKPIIQLSTATRSGNKKVTLVSNLEAYGINIADFSKACKIGVQASTSITKVPGTNIDQFQIQGNHVRFIHKLLTDTYKVAPGNISGLEFAKKEKSKKK